jgi:quinol monooxygenase YgiN
LTVIALLELRIKPDAVAQGHALLNEILADTRAFTGNLGVDVLTDLDDSAHVTVVETWASIEDDLAYRQWRTTPAGASSLGSVLAGAPTLTKFSRASV